MTRRTFGNAIYFPLLLHWIYDTLVLDVYCPLAWGCSKNTLQKHYSRAVSAAALNNATDRPRLLDIGVGTGYWISHAPLAPRSSVLLVDINENPLAESKTRICKAHPTVLVETDKIDVFDLGSAKPVLSPPGGGCGHGDIKFNVTSCMLLLHCLPGTADSKGRALARLSHMLNTDGVLVGATVLGRGVKHNVLGRFIMFWHNLLGIFHNYDDGANDIVEHLKSAFKVVNWRIEGTMLLFEARSPRLQDSP
ncbi:methyltransferase domain-containing protein [Colletotrichum graminicola M1.001]|uniref:Methyltransferase domain-containing protein n=1 Tax=Colletotrichum graminicola (strain M1.001 / M2 / FGSC 10212) TaxID=645133 RepID=E3R0U3_COLGM|nr:methyltransferase domain-containing protein [Colletotrichum graminicola M1.001]EFQ36731.1 methyltransferase domain-containing protein [Colletotrichum graminicola M1.001]